MKKTIVWLLLLSPALLCGQKTKKVVDHDNREVYYVLKSDKTLRHGIYEKYSFGGKLVIKGQYNNGEREGVWDYTDTHGQLIHQYDYTKKELIFINKIEASKVCKIILEDSLVHKQLERPPLYLGGDQLVMEEIYPKIRYPAAAREAGASGTVMVAFMIGKDGKAYDHKVVKGVGYGCDEEALRVVKMIPDNWLSGLFNGQLVDAEYVLPVRYMLVSIK